MSPINPGQTPLLAYHLAVAERCPVKMSGGVNMLRIPYTIGIWGQKSYCRYSLFPHTGNFAACSYLILILFIYVNIKLNTKIIDVNIIRPTPQISNYHDPRSLEPAESAVCFQTSVAIQACKKVQLHSNLICMFSKCHIHMRVRVI